MGIMIGSQFCLGQGYKKIIVEMDSLLWLMLHEETTPRNNNLLAICKELLSREWRVELLHQMEEANQVVDGLARFGPLSADWVPYGVTSLASPCGGSEAVQRDN